MEIIGRASSEVRVHPVMLILLVSLAARMGSCLLLYTRLSTVASIKKSQALVDALVPAKARDDAA